MPDPRSPLAPLSIRGVYINLDRSVERRRAIETQLDALGVAPDYERLAAVDGAAIARGDAPLKAGEVACFRSHLAALRSHAGGSHHLHVVEDDALLSRRLPSVFAEIAASGALDRFDLVFTDTVVPVSVDLVRSLRRYVERNVRRDAGGHAGSGGKFAVVDFGGREFAGASSYLVARRSIARVADLLQAEADRGPSAPVDIAYSRLAASGALRAAFVLPFATAVAPATAIGTTIEGRDGGEAVRFACDLLRYALYVDCDWSVARDAIAAFDPSALDDPALALIGTAFAIAASPRYVSG